MDVDVSNVDLEDAIARGLDVSLTTVFRNTQGVIIPHIPSMTVSADSETFNEDDAIVLTGTGGGHSENEFRTSASFSTFPTPFSQAQL